MKPSILVITCICAVLIIALVLPVSADDASQVTVTPTATITGTRPRVLTRLVHWRASLGCGMMTGTSLRISVQMTRT